ncbi:hypothetical protein AtNW77_Chr4g0279671 [Arabidopsis thaliana]
MKTEGNVFRCFKTRKDTILLTFDRWHPAIREPFLLHAHHSSRANSELNDMIEYYERLLLDKEKDVMAWRDKSSSLESDLRSSNDARLKLEDQLDNLSIELMKSNGKLQEQYQTYDKAGAELESDVREYESNLLLFDQTHEYDFSEERERDELKAVLEEKQNRLGCLSFLIVQPPAVRGVLHRIASFDASGVSGSAEPEVPIAPSSVLEAIITPSEIPPSTNSETVVIEDDDGSDSVIRGEQPATDEPGETETAAADPESV